MEWTLPEFALIRIGTRGERADDVEWAVHEQLAKLGEVKSRRIAVAVGSRGIRNIGRIVKAVVGALRHKEAEVFIVPAMGSHGGGTAESQKAILAGYGIDKAACGCDIVSTTETVEVGRVFDTLPVQVDKAAWEADGIIAVNRIKRHTLFDGNIGSGLQKMLTIGLGNPSGAAAYHRMGRLHGMEAVILSAAGTVLMTGKIMGGLAILENSAHETCRLEWVPGGSLQEREAELFTEASGLHPRLPAARLHGLIVDEIGKDISGTGLDPHVIGRRAVGGYVERIAPTHIEGIYVRSLTEKSKGSAVGVGLCDLIHRRVAEQTDHAVSNLNAFTALNQANVRVPPVFACDREALTALPKMFTETDPAKFRIAWIRNTQDMETMLISEALLDECSADPLVSVERKGLSVRFSQEGELIRP